MLSACPVEMCRRQHIREMAEQSADLAIGMWGNLGSGFEYPHGLRT